MLTTFDGACLTCHLTCTNMIQFKNVVSVWSVHVRGSTTQKPSGYLRVIMAITTYLSRHRMQCATITYWYIPRCTYKQQHRKHLWYHRPVQNSCPQMYTWYMKQLQVRGVTYYTWCKSNCNLSQNPSQQSRQPNLCTVNCQLNFQTHNQNWYRSNSVSQLDFDHGCFYSEYCLPSTLDTDKSSLLKLFISHMTWDLMKWTANFNKVHTLQFDLNLW